MDLSQSVVRVNGDWRTHTGRRGQIHQILQRGKVRSLLRSPVADSTLDCLRIDEGCGEFHHQCPLNADGLVSWQTAQLFYPVSIF
jgi:hypothetical protein